MKASTWGALALAAAVTAVAGVGHAAVYKQEGCQIEVPADWVASKQRVSRPDKKVWAELLKASSTAEVVTLETSLKAVKVGEDGGHVVLMSTASYGGLTNRMYHTVTKGSPACLADVTSPAGPDEALAKSIGHTVAIAK